VYESDERYDIQVGSYIFRSSVTMDRNGDVIWYPTSVHCSLIDSNNNTVRQVYLDVTYDLFHENDHLRLPPIDGVL